jgi:ubiquinone/menaquinone biosynthesis C-methylase UbiE
MSIKGYNKIAKKYHKFTQANFYNAQLELPPMMKLLNSIKISNKRILDLGCGTGRYTKILLRLGGNVWAIDPSEKMLEIARKENKNAHFKKAAASKIPFSSDFFDMVVASLCIDHVREIDKALSEVSRVLKKDGIFIFSRNNPVTEIAENVGERYVFNSYFKEGKRRRYFPSFSVNMAYYHTTLETIIKALIKNGFAIEDFIDVKPNSRSKRKFPKEYGITTNKPYFIILKVRKRA